jgi:hypothetical protein
LFGNFEILALLEPQGPVQAFTGICLISSFAGDDSTRLSNYRPIQIYVKSTSHGVFFAFLFLFLISKY